MANNPNPYSNIWFGDIYCSTYGNAFLSPKPICQDTPCRYEVRLGQFLGRTEDIITLFKGGGIPPIGKKNILKTVKAFRETPKGRKSKAKLYETLV